MSVENCVNPCLIVSRYYKKLQMPNQMCLCGTPAQGVRSDGSWSRRHGWTRPLHPLQGLAFLFLAMFGLLHFGVLIPSLPDNSPWKLAAGLANGLIFGLHVIVLFVCMTLNPGDPNVRLAAGCQPSNSFDRSKRPHVILDQYCCICQVKVGLKSKHCSACNKCISDFDHHCKWLNNCIGGRNYRLFLCCVASALLGCLVILLTSVVLIAAYFCQHSWLNRPFPMRVLENTTRTADHPTNNSSFWPHFHQRLHHDTTLLHDSEGRVFWVFLPVAGSLWLVVVVLTTVLSFLACALLTHLLAFHTYLVCQGLSTYEYIVQKRDQSPNQHQSGYNASHHGMGSSGGRLLKKGLLCPLQKWRRFKKANQVLPIAHKRDEQKQDDVEMTGSQVSSNSHDLQVAPLPPSEGTETVESESLEQRAGDIYLGSPLRRARNLLPPIALPPTVVTSPRGRRQQAFHQDNIEPDQDEQEVVSENKQSFPSSVCENENTQFQSHMLVPPDQDTRSNLRHLSVSTQSLNSFCDTEESSPDPPDESPSTCEDQPNARLSGSLTNLLLLDVAHPDINESEDDFAVHEVNIQQSPFHHAQQEQLFKNRFVSLQDVSSETVHECSPDPNYSGDISCVSTVPTTHRHPSVDVLFIPMDSHNRPEVLVLHDCESKPSLFTQRRTSFMSERSQHQQVLV